MRLILLLTALGAVLFGGAVAASPPAGAQHFPLPPHWAALPCPPRGCAVMRAPREHRAVADTLASSWGPWARATVYFGVRAEGDALVPFTPDWTLTTPISGTATWHGRLIGLTRDRHRLTGRAALQLRVGETAIAGSALFDGLRVEGRAWDGAQALLYPLVAGAKPHTFRNAPGGDAGTLAGRLHGEGLLSGTLARDDFTAAFGAARER